MRKGDAEGASDKNEKALAALINGLAFGSARVDGDSGCQPDVDRHVQRGLWRSVAILRAFGGTAERVTSEECPDLTKSRRAVTLTNHESWQDLPDVRFVPTGTIAKIRRQHRSDSVGDHRRYNFLLRWRVQGGASPE